MYVREKLTDLPYLMLNLSAVDPDLGSNGTVTYELVKSEDQDYTQLFSIHPTKGELLLRESLDADLRSTKRVYELTVRAKDTGGLSSACLVQVNLIDVNDHAPEMTLPVNTIFNFDENDQSVVTRDELFRVNCMDPDATRSEIEYFLVRDELSNNDSVIFSINKHTGQVRTSRVFDFESINEYKFKVVCKDRGVMIDLDNLGRQYEKRLSSEMVYTVRVSDLDDNEPVFVDVERSKLK